MTDQPDDDHPDEVARPWSISIRDLEVRGLAWGNLGDPPLLALHGWQDNAASFIPLMSHLRPTGRFRVLAPDLPGHGRSGWRTQQSAYHFVDWLRDLYDLLQALEWTSCSLIGHSMGAAIASLWAGVFPDRCQSLILIEGLGPLTTPAEECPDQLARALQAQSSPFKERASLDQLIEQRCRLTPMKFESARHLMERSTRTLENRQIQLRQDPMLRMPSLLRLTEPQVRAFLRRVRCEVLLIKAKNGWPFDPHLLQERVACLPRSETQIIEGQHHVHMDESAQVALICEAFLKRTT